MEWAGVREWSLFLLISLCICGTPTSSSRILVLPFNTYSHVKLMTLSSVQLLRAGHQVWMLSSLPPTRHNTSFGQIHWLQVDLPSMKGLMSNVSCVTDSRESYKILFSDTKQLSFGHCKSILTNTTLLGELRAMNFSLAIYDGIHVYQCISILPYILNISYMSLSIQHHAWQAGVPSLPSVEPHQFSPFTSEMNFFQRFFNMIIYIIAEIFFPLMGKNEDRLVRELVPDGPHQTISQVLHHSVLWMTITQPTCLDYPRSTAPHYVEVSVPTPFYDATQVNTHLQAFADGAHQGLVVVTFGCLISDGALPAEIREIFIETFKSFPQQRFVLKHSPDATFNTSALPDNVFAMEWVPLDELLTHRNTRVLVTQSGAVSMNEAVLHGVPLLVIPFLADQTYNAKRAAQHGWGLAIDRRTFSKHTLREALWTLLHDESYTTSARLCKGILNSIPSGEESVAFWVDHVFTHGWRHLHFHEKPASMIVLLVLDVSIVLILIVGCALIMVIKVFLAFVLVWARTMRKYPWALQYMWPWLTVFFMITMVHSILTAEV